MACETNADREAMKDDAITIDELLAEIEHIDGQDNRQYNLPPLFTRAVECCRRLEDGRLLDVHVLAKEAGSRPASLREYTRYFTDYGVSMKVKNKRIFANEKTIKEIKEKLG